jgi:hypothetical protein
VLPRCGKARMDAFRQSGYLERITAERGQRSHAAVSSYA